MSARSTKFSRLVSMLVAVSAVSCISGCAFLQGSAAGSAFVDRDMRHLRLPEASTPERRVVVYRSPFQYQEYHRSSAGGRAEVMYIQATGQGTALNIDADRLQSLARLWRFNRPASRLTWENLRYRRVDQSGIHFLLYRNAGMDGAPAQNCAAFVRTWDFQSLDPQYRPDKAYFGYLCRPPNQALYADAVVAYLRDIDIASPPMLGFHLGQSVPRDDAARPLALGAGEPGWGIPAFPLQRIGRYPIGGAYSDGH